LFNIQKNSSDFKFDFNGVDNGIMMPKRSVVLDINGHTVHNDYSREISRKISEICNRTDIDDISKFEHMQDLIKSTKNTLINEVLLGSKNVNDIVIF
jgi:hypothetical protein